MAAICELEDLKAVSEAVAGFKKEYPEAYSDLKDLLKVNRKVGYKNICKLILGETTPEKLKGME